MLCGIPYTWNLKYDTSKLNDTTDSQTSRTDLWLPGGGGGVGWEAGVSRCKVLQREWTQNKVLCAAQAAIFHVLC